MTGWMSTSDIYDVAIAGAGPAGASAAIHLAQQGLRVLLAEQKKFPRAKLCGEFISPECVRHFEQLGVATEIASAGGSGLAETSFYSRKGNKLTVPIDWFEKKWTATGLSRAEMDLRLLLRAKQLGVTVLENASVVDLMMDAQRVAGIRIRASDGIKEFSSRVTLDATGRARALARKLDKSGNGRQRSRLVAFKAHLENARVSPGSCEIYVYPGGYGGLNNIENGLSNLCFIAAARDVRHFGSDPVQLMKARLMRNARAAFTLGEAKVATDWLSVALESFGRQKLVPVEGLLMVGDAAAFIDPFTGSGILMALENGAVAAQTIAEFRDRLHESSFSELASRYRSNYTETFSSRLRISGWLRRAAFVPFLAEAAMTFFGFSDSLRRKVAQATRRPSHSTAGISFTSLTVTSDPKQLNSR